LLAAHCRAALQVSCNPGFFAQYPPFCGKSAQVSFHEQLTTNPTFATGAEKPLFLASAAM
jgi:hypothetical protein